MTDFKTLKDLMVIFEKKWKYFYENRNDFLSDDIHKVFYFNQYSSLEYNFRKNALYP